LKANKQTALALAGQADEFGLSGPSVLSEYFQLTKPRIELLIVIATAVGYCFGIGSTFHIGRLLNALLGTALMAAGSATLNQWYERDIDKKMNRTKGRPIPTGTISARNAFIFGVLVSVLGFVELLAFTNYLAALLSFATSFGYLFVYTPLKQRSPLCTTIGAIPGAMPPLIGFAAASGHLTMNAWILFGILFFWQFPHFHAIARMYRDDYARGGVKMLAVVDQEGRSVRWQIIVNTLLLIAVSLTPAFAHMAGRLYLSGAFLLGLGLLYFARQICKEYTFERARHLLLASVIYMPLLFALLVFDNPRFRF
jgi:protoheme IX farnesyltransferase